MNRAVAWSAAAVVLAGLAACQSSSAPTVGITYPIRPTIPPVPVGPGAQAAYAAQPQPTANSCHYRYLGAYPLPDPTCTTGATNPGVTQANVQSTICVRGWTATIRPPLSVTSVEKRANALSYGGGQNARTDEYDHLIALEDGGDPNDPRNLWVEPNDVPSATGPNNSKDAVENAARVAVCSGQLPLATVQAGLAHNWVSLGRQLGLIK